MEKNTDFQSAYKFFDQAPVIIGFVRGKDYIVEFANEGLLNVWKVDKSIYGKSIFQVFPELEQQGFRHLLDSVQATGNPFTAYEYPITFHRQGKQETYYFDFIYKPFYEGEEITGVISVGHDVTEKVQAKKLVEQGDKKWKLIANSLPVVVWTADEKGNVDFFNDLWYQTTGLTPEETLGFGWATVLHPDDRERCVKAWNDALTMRLPYEIEARYRKKDGNYLWVLARGVPILDKGTVLSWYGTSTDITTQKNKERQLQETVRGRTEEVEQKDSLLQSILNNSTNGISVSQMIFNDRGEVVDALTILANDAAVKFAGLPREDYLSKPASYFDPNIISSPYGQACIKTLKTGEPFIMRYFLEFSKRWLELTVSRMDDSRLIHHFTDVTEIREAELKLEKTLEDLRYSNANLEEFAYAASHDLKEPIRKAQFYTNRLKEDLRENLNVEQKRLFDRLENSHARMYKLIIDLLEYSQAAKGTSEKSTIDLNDLVKAVLEDLELEVQRKAAQIEVSPLPAVTGSKRQIHQLFQNLIGNALKYTHDIRLPVIKVYAEIVLGKDYLTNPPGELREKQFHLITVSDNGIGFEQEHADKIFKVFTRLHANEQYRGSGVGLSIVKKVVESHNGFVWAESQPSVGSVFKILLPVERGK